MRHSTAISGDKPLRPFSDERRPKESLSRTALASILYGPPCIAEGGPFLSFTPTGNLPKKQKNNSTELFPLTSLPRLTFFVIQISAHLRIKKDVMGFFFSLLSSATFGLIPLFSLPLMAQGLSPATVLFYRFFIATIVLGILLLLRGERFHTSGRNLVKLAGMSLMYSLAALLFMQAFKHLPSGVVATLHFSYPVMVMLIMIAFFHERFSSITAIAVTLAIAGVYLLSNGELTGGSSSAGFAGMSMLGLTLALASALCNSLYITSIYTARLTNITGLMLTFYVMAFGALCSLTNSLATGSFQLLTSWRELLLAVLLALVTAVLSNFTLILAVQRIGSTLASVLGVMEPVTAVIVGILVFNEPFSLPLVMGIVLIGSSVVLIMLGEHIRQLMTRRKAAKQNGSSADS